MVSHGEYADGKDRQEDGRQTVTLRFPLDAASVKYSKVSIAVITIRMQS